LVVEHGSVIAAAHRPQAGEISTRKFDGSPYVIKDRAPRVIVMSFMASWCGPCQKELPTLQGFYASSDRDQVDVIGVDTKDGSAEGAQQWLAENHVSFPAIYDENGRTGLQLGQLAIELPSSVLIDRRGRIAAVYLGALSAPDLARSVEGLLAESA